MTGPANPLDDPADAAALDRYGADFLAALEAAVPAWVERRVQQRWSQWSGEAPPAGVLSGARVAGEAARDEVITALRELLATDVDEQRMNPLALIRGAVVHPAAVLAAAGVPPARRDADAERIFPEDVYDLSPASFAEVDPSLHEPGVAWGAAKAHVILARRRRG